MGMFDWFRKKEPSTKLLGGEYPDSYMSIQELIDIGQGGLRRFGRDRLIQYPAFFRAIELTSAGVATLVAESRLTIVDRDGKRVENRRTGEILDMCSWSPGNYESAYQFWEDLATDYCLEGNGFVVVHRDSTGQAMRLERMKASLAAQSETQRGQVYRLQDLGSQTDMPYGARDVLHPRFPLMYDQQTNSSNYRNWFAPRPMDIVNNAVKTGMLSDERVLKQLNRNKNRDNMHVDFNKLDELSSYSEEQRKELVELMMKWSTSGKPLATFNNSRATRLDMSPEDEMARLTREYQLAETVRCFGVPPPLLGMHVTEWGEGIESLSRLWYRFGLHNHVSRFLSSMQTKLLRRGEKFHFDETYATRGDWENIARIVSAVSGDAQRPPLATREEIRDMLGLLSEPRGEYVEKTPDMKNGATIPPMDDGDEESK